MSEFQVYNRMSHLYRDFRKKTIGCQNMFSWDFPFNREWSFNTHGGSWKFRGGKIFYFQCGLRFFSNLNFQTFLQSAILYINMLYLGIFFSVHPTKSDELSSWSWATIEGFLHKALTKYSWPPQCRIIKNHSFLTKTVCQDMESIWAKETLRLVVLICCNYPRSTKCLKIVQEKL